MGCTPSWWQLFKALHEMGNEIIVVPYLGDPIQSLWWRTYPNPCSIESKLCNSFLESKKKKGIKSAAHSPFNACLSAAVHNYIKPKWEAHLRKIIEKEKDINALLFMNVPINHVSGIPLRLKEEYGLKVAYLDGDMPTILPQYADERGFKFNYYVDADLSEFDAFFTNSKGVIPDLENMGARNVHPIYYAADPELFRPIEMAKDIDFSFFGYGSEYREEWMTKMITEPSKDLACDFAVGGKGFGIDLGRARLVGDFPYSAFKEFCCRSRVCLNITRWSHTRIYASSTARPFELAAYGSCIVSQPYNGIEEWFEPGREIEVVNSKDEATEAYKWLLDDKASREEMGRRARERILRDHTYRHRAEEMVKYIGNGSEDGDFKAQMRTGRRSAGQL